MKTVSLNQVVHKCVMEPRFFRALLRNPQRELVHAGLHITARDMKKLKRRIAEKGAMKDFAIYSKIIRKYTHTPQGILW